MTADLPAASGGQNILTLNRSLSLPQRQEPGVAIEESQYERLIERLEGCSPRGLRELWMAFAGAAAGVAAAAAVGAMTLPPHLTPGLHAILWVLAGAAAVVFAVCLFGYFSQKGDETGSIAELKQDMLLHLGRPLPAPATRHRMWPFGHHA